MGDPLNPETYLGPVKDGDVVIDAAGYMGVLESTVGLMRYQCYARMVGSPVVVADASTCRVFVDRRVALRAVRELLGRNAEVTRERDEALRKLADARMRREADTLAYVNVMQERDEARVRVAALEARMQEVPRG